MMPQSVENVELVDRVKEDERSKEDLKSAIVVLLESNAEIGMNCDLACYPTHDGFFHVDYVLCPETVNLLNLNDQEKKTLAEEEELMEIFDKADEAADFYLRLTGGRMTVCSDAQHGHGHSMKSSKKRTLKQKMKAYDKDKYF